MFKIPLKVRYAVFATLDLALRYGEGPIQAKVIARRQSIPTRYLEHVLHALKQGGVVESIRGPQGGYVLRYPPSQVSVSSIVEALNGSAESNADAGMNGHSLRTLRQESLLSTTWERVRQAEREVLQSVTLETLIERHRQIEQTRASMYHI